MGVDQGNCSTEKYKMSWTWAGFWQDDPVFRFNGGDFFQSGRNKAEERFWKKYIHDDGSYRTPLRSRASSGVSFMSVTSLPSSNSSVTSSENDDALKNLQRESKVTEEEKKEEDNEEKKDEKEDEEMSTFTCLSCGHCGQVPEKERFI